MPYSLDETAEAAVSPCVTCHCPTSSTYVPHPCKLTRTRAVPVSNEA